MNFEKKLNQNVEVSVVPPEILYNYKGIRPGKPLSRVIDTVKGKKEIVEGALKRKSLGRNAEVREMKKHNKKHQYWPKTEISDWIENRGDLTW